MKVIFRFILYIGTFYLLMTILSFFLIAYAIIYDFVKWLIQKTTTLRKVFTKVKYSNHVYSRDNDNYQYKYLPEVGHTNQKLIVKK